jgi:hypothetical protein
MKKNSKKKVKMPFNPPKVKKPCTHLAGEYFVAAELSKMGFNVAMTVGNAKKVDLIIEDDGVTVPIQVKAIALKKSVGWPINVDAQYDKNLIFICVVLGKSGEAPEYYILTGSDVMSLRKKYKTRAILNLYSVKDCKNNWALIEHRITTLRKKLI